MAWPSPIVSRTASFLAIVSSCILLFSGCDQRSASGSSSGTSNTLTGRILDGSNHPMAGCRIVALSARWSASDSATIGANPSTTTDDSGRFSLPDLPSDAWVVEATGDHQGYLFPPTLAGGGASVDLGVGRSGPLGSLAGHLLLDSSLHSLSGTVQISGTNHSVALLPDGSFRMEGIPPGLARLRAQLQSSAGPVSTDTLEQIGRELPRAVVLLTGTADSGEDYSTWTGQRTAIIDATATGGHLVSMETGVPLMVRLDGTILSDWDLTGASLRFSSGSGNHLPYEIEYWNPATKQARVWVRMDTLAKNTKSRSITVHWGKPGAPDRSDGTSVYPASDGWMGVWHLSGPNPYQDATVFHRNLTSLGSRPVAGPEGGMDLDRTSTLVLDDPSIMATGGVTAFVFVRLDSVSSRPAFVFRRGSPDSSVFDWAMVVRDTGGAFQAGFSLRSQVGNPFPQTSRPVPRSSWTLLGGIFDTSIAPDTSNSIVRLVLPDTVHWSQKVGLSVIPRNTTSEFIVGGGIVGRIDEIRLARAVASPDFVRAQWLSWDPSSTLLKWQP